MKLIRTLAASRPNTTAFRDPTAATRIEDLLAADPAGDLVRDIAAWFDVSRTTVIGHLARRRLSHRREND